MKLVASTLRSLLDYDPLTGIFTWRCSRGHLASGSRAGTVSRGYETIGVNRIRYMAHRLAWLHFYGEWPHKYIDHVNRDGTDNRIVNLRLASASQNGGNSRLSKKNSSGFKGISRNGSGYMAQITVDRIKHYLGTFRTPREAHAVYCEAAKNAFGEFSHP